jgi:hypothetical protein
MFIHLPPRQRELIKQALSDKLPPEFSALIQQYYVNIARGQPAARPANPAKDASPSPDQNDAKPALPDKR